MISKRELMELAGEFSLDVNVVEKDYVLGWLLAGINHHHFLTDKWIFKGGTCLKKCYFETYRFSEDLDYTLIDGSQIDEAFLIMCFNDISQWLYEVTGIEIPKETIQFKIKDNKKSAEGKVGYIGPMERRRDPARVKLDLTVNERMVTAPDLRSVHHPYKDNPEGGIKSYCYSFSEIFAEKLRALGERARPRDLYDIIHLFRHANTAESGVRILETLKKKCEFI
jgi:predicted nucleotidyltransferase component of viral defense system